MPVDALITTLPPEQKVVAVAALEVAEGQALTITTTAVEVSEHPLAFVTNTRYEPAALAV